MGVIGMKQVVDSDSTAIFFQDPETKQYILAGAGELHIEILVSSLQEISGIEVELSEPMISYRETVEDESYEVALAKSANKHNRIFVKASPIGNDIVKMLVNKDLKD